MAKPNKVIHSAHEKIRQNVHVVLVRPEEARNVGAVARALANMGILGSLRIVGDPALVKDEEGLRLAKHARAILEKALIFRSLEDALSQNLKMPVLTLAATARVGSPHRPHPIRVRAAVGRGVSKLMHSHVAEILFIFGPEGSGLTNNEVRACDWVVTIPSSFQYRSLNLAQSVLIFCYEANMALLAEDAGVSIRPSQKERLVEHLLRLAEQVGFIFPEDPFKMKPHLEEILSYLPNHIKEIKTLHGLIEQIRRKLGNEKMGFHGKFKSIAVEKGFL